MNYYQKRIISKLIKDGVITPEMGDTFTTEEIDRVLLTVLSKPYYKKEDKKQLLEYYKKSIKMEIVKEIRGN